MGIPFVVNLAVQKFMLGGNLASNGAVHGDLDDTERPNDFCGGCGEYALAWDNAGSAILLPRWKVHSRVHDAHCIERDCMNSKQLQVWGFLQLYV
jgi:hypothetical protein